MRDFRKYDIWTDSMELVNEVYNLMDAFPDNEKYGLQSQIGRSVVSIPSNIAEGAGRKLQKEFWRFIEITLGSAFELETQLLITQRRKFVPLSEIEKLIIDLHSIQKRMSGLMFMLK